MNDSGFGAGVPVSHPLQPGAVSADGSHRRAFRSRRRRRIAVCRSRVVLNARSHRVGRSSAALDCAPRWTRSRIGRTRFLGREAGLMGIGDAWFRPRWIAWVGAVAAAVALVLACLPATASAGRMGSPSVAALQVGLRAKGLYSGTVDGFAGPGTRAAVRSLQRRAGISVDGIAGPQTLGVLGRRGRPRLGSRAIGPGSSGFDVAELQFLLAWHGFPSGSIDGGYGSHTQAAIIRFQRWARLGRDGIAGAGTLRRLLSAPRRSPVTLAKPIA